MWIKSSGSVHQVGVMPLMSTTGVLIIGTDATNVPGGAAETSA
jgi:hypothetical protein